MRRHLQFFSARHRPGFTLAEIMVAMFILVAAVLSGSVFFTSMARSAAFTKSAVEATGLAQDKLEELLEQTRGSMTAGSDSIDGYTRSWVVSNETDLTVLEVTVNWNALGGNTHSISLDTLRAH